MILIELVLINFINTRNTKSIDCLSDMFIGHVSKPYSNAVTQVIIVILPIIIIIYYIIIILICLSYYRYALCLNSHLMEWDREERGSKVIRI